MRTLVWFRGKDLRLSDHPALTRALDLAGASPTTEVAENSVVPVFVMDPFFFAPERARELPHRMQFLLESLEALQHNLAHLGATLVIVRGRSHEMIPMLAKEFQVDKVVAMRWVEPFGRSRDAKVKAALGALSMPVDFELLEGETLHTLGTVNNGSGKPYGVFTPFSKAFFSQVKIDAPLPPPARLPKVRTPPSVQCTPIPSLAELGLTHNPNLQRGGEREALTRLKIYAAGAAKNYAEVRDRMDLAQTSRLSADLKFGTLSIRHVYRTIARVLAGDEAKVARTRYLTELVWREFSHMLLWEHPELLQRPFRADFAQFPWRSDALAMTHLERWKMGTTGYPVVDAASRQLLAEGFVHNRARMIAASFFCKHLRLDYKLGEAHYLKYLTDGDWAQNNSGWQWSAGCGCDAQPYFRVFNPMTQGEKFDPEGVYVRRWLPELANLPAPYIHAPWLAPPLVLKGAGVVLGKTYPEPIVVHEVARNEFLAIAKAHLAKAKAPAVALAKAD
jgi:deoxyribodipyrimidine photo-lyase